MIDLPDEELELVLGVLEELRPLVHRHEAVQSLTLGIYVYYINVDCI